MSPDPSGLYYADPGNPQSLNLYNYGWNNPLTNIDPTGLDCAKDNGDGTVTYNTGDCANENEDAANHEYYINCDGCTSGAAGATLDSATGDLYATDANGKAKTGTTVQGWADPQGTPSTNVNVSGGANGDVSMSGFGFATAEYPNAIQYFPYANFSMPPGTLSDPNAGPPVAKVKPKDRWLCLYGSMTNEMMGEDGGPQDSGDAAPGHKGAAPIPFNYVENKGKNRGKEATMTVGPEESGDAKGEAGAAAAEWGGNAFACFINSF